MQARHRQRRFAQVNPQYLRTTLGHAFSQNTAAAADIQHPLPGQPANVLLDVIKPQRIQIVQGFKFAVRIPPTAGEFLKFGDFLQVYVEMGGRGHIR